MTILQAFVANRPVKARPASALYRFGKFVRRNKVAVGLSGLMLTGTAVGGTYVELQHYRAEKAGEIAAHRAQFITDLLASVDPSNDNPNVTVAALLDSATKDLDRKLGSDPLAEAATLEVIANTNASLGRYPEAQAANDREIGLLRANGGSAVELGRALGTRGSLLRELGKWPEALPPLQEALELLRGQNSPADLCGVMDTLGSVLQHSNQEKAAEAVYRDEIAIEMAGAAKLRAMRMNAFYGMSVLKLDQGLYEESARYGSQALAAARETLPADHPWVLNIETAYANDLSMLHRSAEAETLFRQVIEAQTRQVGAEHKHTLLSKLALASNLMQQNKNPEAAALTLPVARSLEGLLGEENIYTLSAWNQYGLASCRSGQEKEGIAALKRVAGIRARIYPAGNWMIASTQEGIGVCELHLHQFATAETTLLASVATLEAARGTAFARTQDGYRDLGELYKAMGKSEEAARWNSKLSR